MAEQKRIAVGGSPGDGAGSDVPATTAPVVHDHLLAKRGRQLLANDSAIASTPPPGGYGTINVIGRVG